MSSVQRAKNILIAWSLVIAAGCGENPSPQTPTADVDSLDSAAVEVQNAGDVPDATTPTDSIADAATVDATTADESAVADVPADVLAEIDGSAPGPDAVTATDAGPACQTAADCAASTCQDAACVGGQCLSTATADGAPCPSTDKCATSGACEQGKCKLAATKPCSDGNPCTADGCDPGTGACLHGPTLDAPCSDGNPCTKGDKCSTQGACEPGANVCASCSGIKDCAQYDDGNGCNGSLFCNQGKSPALCDVLPSSVVLCDGAADSICAHAACNPANGLCEMAPAANGEACDDGNPCTQEACSNGQCASKVNVCQCEQDGDCGVFDDGNQCNGTLFCDKASVPYVCKTNPGTVTNCAKSGDPCVAATCEAKTGKCGMAPVLAGVPCDDGNPKTVGDTCVVGKCQPGVDTAVCKATADCAKLEDGDLCNGTKFCNLATGECQDNPATVVSCPSVDDTACQQNKCQAKTGKCEMVNQNEGLGCNDGNPCSTGDICQKGACTASAMVCACLADTDCAAKDDGDLCNGTLFCDKLDHTCKLNPKTVVTCQSADDSSCTKRKCDAKTGQCPLVPVADGLACDAGSTCLVDATCQKGACVSSADTCLCKKDADCTAQEDGNVCNGTLYCDLVGHECKVNPASVVVCPTALDSICQKTQCDPGSGKCQKVNVNNGAQCDADSNPCTANDWCEQGMCKPGAMVCNCVTDADCAGKQGADLCIGVMVCDPKSHECTPAKLVACDQKSDGMCQLTACNPGTGKCETKQRPDGVVCDANTLCAGAQTCLTGACVQGKPVNCDDANPCTAESCEPKQGGCLHLALDATPCSDGSACTSSDTCAKGNCVGTTVPCNDNEACTDDACEPNQGCTHVPVAATVCSDGNACTTNDACVGAVCKGGAAPECIDGNPCTQDTCDTTTGCEHPAETNGSACDDGDICTSADACNGGNCGGGPLDCGDNNPCTADLCTPPGGCKHVATKGACDDGNLCTVGDTCKAGECSAGFELDCEDGNACTDDTCLPVGGCTAANVVGVQCSDGDVCTLKDSCVSGVCTAGSQQLDCNDGNSCTTDSCKAGTGCAHLAGVDACNDGNVCTTGDNCVGGSCVPGGAIGCDDENPCTADGCDMVAGCQHKATTATCDDGNPCTVSDPCKAGTCSAGSLINCADDNSCTLDGCSTVTGCTHTVKTGSCDDGNSCTAKDVCVEAKCVSGNPLNCDDKNQCTIDSCDPVNGCQFAPNAAACDDGNSCTVGDFCSQSYCHSGVGFKDTDADGFKDKACAGNDCNDAVATIHPGATEVCNSLDDNCNSVTDDACVP